MPYVTHISPAEKLGRRVRHYLIFDIVLALLPIIVDIVMCFTFDHPGKKYYEYNNSLCTMNIILAATSIKSIVSSKTILQNKHIKGLLLSASIVIIFVATLIYGGIVVDEFSQMTSPDKLTRQFIIFLVMYIVNFVLGFVVQIGSSTDE